MTLKLITFGFGLAAVACFLAAKILGSTVGPDGILVEPFALIPLGYLSGLICLLGAAVIWARAYRR